MNDKQHILDNNDNNNMIPNDSCKLGKKSVLVTGIGKQNEGFSASHFFEKESTVDIDSGDFTQLCVMHDTRLGKCSPDKFIKDLTRIFDCQFKFEKELELPENHIDLLFYVHREDKEKFGVKMSTFDCVDINWWEDAITKYPHRYPLTIHNKYPKKW